MNFRRMFKSRFTSIIALIFGLTLFSTPLFLRLYNSYFINLILRNKKEVFAQYTTSPILISKQLLKAEYAISDYPYRIVIPSVGINLAVKPSRVVNGLWEIQDDIANYGVGSGIPNKQGNIVIFAHARENLFFGLRMLKNNELISLQTKDGDWLYYKIVEIKEVSPNQIEVIAPSDDKTLTLYTCTGFADSKRLIVVAKQSHDV